MFHCAILGADAMKPKKLQPRAARQATRRLDAALRDLQLPPHPRKGWIRAIREALGMTQNQLARRMGITRQAVALTEASELDHSATLGRLKRAAQELGCELRYVLVPKIPLESMIADQARRRAEKKLGRVNQSQALEASAMSADSMSSTVADLARELELNRAADLWDE
jgi:predicted DNA-binding mobile mystery protein A